MKELVKFDPIVTALRKAVVPMMKMSVTDQASKEQAELALRIIKGYEKKTEDVHGEYKAPILEEGRALDQKKRDILAELLNPKAHLNSILVAYNQKIRAAQEAERQRLEEERRVNDLKARQALEAARVMSPTPKIRADEEARIATEARAKQDEIAVAKKEMNSEAVSGVRHNWKFKIVDPSKVPVHLMIPDETKIGRIVRTMGEDAAKTIPGIVVWDEPSVASGAIAPPVRPGRSLR